MHGFGVAVRDRHGATSGTLNPHETRKSRKEYLFRGSLDDTIREMKRKIGIGSYRTRPLDIADLITEWRRRRGRVF